MTATKTSRFTYEQVAETLKADITRGKLKPGDRLPPIRTLAESFGISAGTAQNALTHLREQGFVRSGSTRGYFVSAEEADSAKTQPQGQSLAEQLAAVRGELQRLVKRVDELERMIRDAVSLESSTDR